MTHNIIIRIYRASLFIAAVLLVFAFFSSHFAARAAIPKKEFLVVIDPGHGGKDHGAVHKIGGKTIKEKDLVLKLAKELTKELAKIGIRTRLTRHHDKNIPLPERTAMANRAGADVFISIHMNSAKYSAQGIETYILNNSTDATSKRLADLENSVLDGSIADAQAQTDVSLIVKDLLLDANLTESKHLACAIQSGVVKATSNSKSRKKKNRGVKQALFYVLLGADMPSVLFEAGFLNNSRDRQLVTSDWGKKQIARSMATAINQYRVQKGTPSAVRTLARCKAN